MDGILSRNVEKNKKSSKTGENLLKKNEKSYIIFPDKKRMCKNVFFAYNKESVTMDFKNRQEQFDRQKWFDSVLAGEDTCGSYDFCSKCCKTEQYPCARAEHRFNGRYIRLAVVRRRR